MVSFTSIHCIHVCRLTQEYHNLKEKQVSLQNEKREYEAQIELLQRTVKQYEEMILKKVWMILCSIYTYKHTILIDNNAGVVVGLLYC